MTRIVVLFNLKPDASAADYEAWAKASDLPTVKALASVADFTVHRATGLLGTDASPPYRYVEIIDVDDMQRFGEEVSSDVMQKVAAEFQAFADQPLFLLTENLD